MRLVRAGARSPSRHVLGPAEEQSPPGPRRTNTSRRAASRRGTDERVAYRPLFGTISPRPPGIPLQSPQPPRWIHRPRLPPRNVSDPLDVRPRGGRGTLTRHVPPGPRPTFEYSSHPPVIRCCDDKLNLPWTPRSL